MRARVSCLLLSATRSHAFSHGERGEERSRDRRYTVHVLYDTQHSTLGTAHGTRHSIHETRDTRDTTNTPAIRDTRYTIPLPYDTPAIRYTRFPVHPSPPPPCPSCPPMCTRRWLACSGACRRPTMSSVRPPRRRSTKSGWRSGPTCCSWDCRSRSSWPRTRRYASPALPRPHAHTHPFPPADAHLCLGHLPPRVVQDQEDGHGHRRPLPDPQPGRARCYPCQAATLPGYRE